MCFLSNKYFEYLTNSRTQLLLSDFDRNKRKYPFSPSKLWGMRDLNTLSTNRRTGENVMYYLATHPISPLMLPNNQ